MTDVSAGFRPPCWCPCRWAPTWRLHTNLYKFGETFLRISSIRKIAVTWILARVFVYLPSFYFQILDLIYLTVFIFLFWSILNGVTLKTSNRDKRYNRWFQKRWYISLPYRLAVDVTNKKHPCYDQSTSIKIKVLDEHYHVTVSRAQV